MLIPNHPDDERLSALASDDTDATADTSLTAHVSTCTRCTDLVHELGALRASLADLPDLAPSRPLRLLPPVDEPTGADRLGGWARRFFAPVLTAGAALAMVGVVGTASPALLGGAQSGGDAANFELAAPAASEAAALGGEDAPAAAEPSAAEAAEETVSAEHSLESADPLVDEGTSTGQRTTASGERAAADADDDDAATTIPAERSPWPMVLFAGVALMVAAGLLRWILGPRSG
ncbi:MAG: hypothetical protein M3Y31_01660 [Gemmatimonadota bacterium]|jgi:hypothetical protein|nr:hypothetical protein [Gemmatimonadota bacterium]